MDGVPHPFHAIAKRAFNAEINAATGTIVIRTGTPGLYVICYELFLQPESTTDITILSASESLTGPIFLGGGERLHVGGRGLPVFKTHATGANFQLTNSNLAQVNGWALIAEVDQ